MQALNSKTIPNDKLTELESAIIAIHDCVNPSKIILFGSYANGTYKEDSDFDLCIIVNSFKGIRKIDTMYKIRKSLMGQVTTPIDLLIYEEEEFNEKIAWMSTMEYAINEEGSLIYG